MGSRQDSQPVCVSAKRFSMLSLRRTDAAGTDFAIARPPGEFKSGADTDLCQQEVRESNPHDPVFGPGLAH